jgi:GTPase
VLDEDKETLLADLSEPGQRLILCQGGNGGWGNMRFKSSVNQAPYHANPGAPGEERWVWLRLKLIADAGLIGLPNAGKSTFLRASSAATPKVADYPFTTLHPHLGVVNLGDGSRFVLADIPGLIEGAADGAGLGTRFLGHVERCACLLHLVDGTQDDVAAAYRTVRGELEAYGEGLADKIELVALNKTDALSAEEIEERRAGLAEASGRPVATVSGVSGDGVRAMLGAIWREVRRARGEVVDEDDAPEPAADGWSP